jgi:hypothetical protein
MPFHHGHSAQPYLSDQAGEPWFMVSPPLKTSAPRRFSRAR